MADIIKTYNIAAPLAAVYEKWISNDTVIPPAEKMDVTTEVGGKYILYSKFGDVDSKMEGVFSEVIPNEKLVYSWEWNNDGDVSQVDVSFATEQGGTLIHLKHTGLKDEESMKNHLQGWDSYLTGFSTLF